MAEIEERVYTNFPILRKLAEIASNVPRQSWDKLPSDLSVNLDHYVYGLPKR